MIPVPAYPKFFPDSYHISSIISHWGPGNIHNHSIKPSHHRYTNSRHLTIHQTILKFEAGKLESCDQFGPKLAQCSWIFIIFPKFALQQYSIWNLQICVHCNVGYILKIFRAALYWTGLCHAEMAPNLFGQSKEGKDLVLYKWSKKTTCCFSVHMFPGFCYAFWHKDFCSLGKGLAW